MNPAREPFDSQGESAVSLPRPPMPEVVSAASLHGSFSRFADPLLPSYTAPSFFGYLTSLLSLHLLFCTHHNLQSLAYPPAPKASKPYCGALFFILRCQILGLSPNSYCVLLLLLLLLLFSIQPLGKISTLIPLTSSSSGSVPCK